MTAHLPGMAANEVIILRDYAFYRKEGLCLAEFGLKEKKAEQNKENYK